MEHRKICSKFSLVSVKNRGKMLIFPQPQNHSALLPSLHPKTIQATSTSMAQTHEFLLQVSVQAILFMLRANENLHNF